VFAGNWDAFRAGLAQLPQIPDFWVWFYLAFTISSTMLPSASDRQSWLPLGLIVVVLVGLAVLAGAGPWMAANLAPRLNEFLRAVGALFGFSVVLHLSLLAPFWLARAGLTRLTGMQVTNG